RTGEAADSAVCQATDDVVPRPIGMPSGGWRGGSSGLGGENLLSIFRWLKVGGRGSRIIFWEKMRRQALSRYSDCICIHGFSCKKGLTPCAFRLDSASLE